MFYLIFTPYISNKIGDALHSNWESSIQSMIKWIQLKMNKSPTAKMLFKLFHFFSFLLSFTFYFSLSLFNPYRCVSVASKTHTTNFNWTVCRLHSIFIFFCVCALFCFPLKWSKWIMSRHEITFTFQQIKFQSRSHSTHHTVHGFDSVARPRLTVSRFRIFEKERKKMFNAKQTN